MTSRAVAAALATIAIPLALGAQTTTPKTIGEVTLFGEEQLKVEAATKTEIPISKAPSAVTVVTAKQIQESGARTVPDLLRLVAGVNVRWNPMVDDHIRAWRESVRTAFSLLIDGSPYNSATRVKAAQPRIRFFPVQNIKRVEVVRGPIIALRRERVLGRHQHQTCCGIRAATCSSWRQLTTGR
jgi:outer membrane receptor for ferrienterochelin and colicin